MADRPFGEVGESLSFVLSLMQKKCGEISPHFFIDIEWLWDNQSVMLIFDCFPQHFSVIQ